MKVNRNQIITGLDQYIHADVMSKIPDRSLLIALEMGLTWLKRHPERIDSYLKFCETNGEYDLDEIIEIAQGALKTHGAFPVTVPAIPFISPAEKILSFSADDIATLKQYIEGGKAL